MVQGNPEKFTLRDSSLSDLERRAFVGFHAFIGNDYLSSFFRKGKKTLWDKVKIDEEALNTFAILGTEYSVPKLQVILLKALNVCSRNTDICVAGTYVQCLE